MANKVVLLGDIIQDTKSGDILGISDRAKIIRYIERALEIAEFKTNWNRYVQTIDVCSDSSGCITLPSFVDTVLAVNVNGFPSYPRNGWYEFHINGLGSRDCGQSNVLGSMLSYTWDDKGFTPCFQDLEQWSVVAAIVEDPKDGDGSLSIRVMGETVDGMYNSKDVLTIPNSGPSEPGVLVPLLINYAATDSVMTRFKRITRVIKPVTRGYVKLIAFTGDQMTAAKTIGYYGPNETNPSYRRIKVNAACKWCRIKFRRSDVPLVNDFDIIPLPSRQATLDLIKAIRLRETNNIDLAESYETKALQLLNDIQQIEDGPGAFQLQVDPGFGLGTVDYR